MKNSIKIQRNVAIGILAGMFLGLLAACGRSMYLQVGVKMGWVGYLIPFIPVTIVALVIWCAYAISRDDA